jgi:hypothetical protein
MSLGDRYKVVHGFREGLSLAPRRRSIALRNLLALALQFRRHDDHFGRAPGGNASSKTLTCTMQGLPSQRRHAWFLGCDRLRDAYGIHALGRADRRTAVNWEMVDGDATGHDW